ncbi:hypothetical protein B484DRAFT_473418, partial [Ochromonadaceae sp. CCMP2298]
MMAESDSDSELEAESESDLVVNHRKRQLPTETTADELSGVAKKVTAHVLEQQNGRPPRGGDGRGAIGAASNTGGRGYGGFNNTGRGGRFGRGGGAQRSSYYGGPTQVGPGPAKRTRKESKERKKQLTTEMNAAKTQFINASMEKKRVMSGGLPPEEWRWVCSHIDLWGLQEEVGFSTDELIAKFPGFLPYAQAHLREVIGLSTRYGDRRPYIALSGNPAKKHYRYEGLWVDFPLTHSCVAIRHWGAPPLPRGEPAEMKAHCEAQDGFYTHITRLLGGEQARACTEWMKKYDFAPPSQEEWDAFKKQCSINGTKHYKNGTAIFDTQHDWLLVSSCKNWGEYALRSGTAIFDTEHAVLLASGCTNWGEF